MNKNKKIKRLEEDIESIANKLALEKEWAIDRDIDLAMDVLRRHGLVVSEKIHTDNGLFGSRQIEHIIKLVRD